MVSRRSEGEVGQKTAWQFEIETPGFFSWIFNNITELKRKKTSSHPPCVGSKSYTPED